MIMFRKARVITCLFFMLLGGFISLAFIKAKLFSNEFNIDAELDKWAFIAFFVSLCLVFINQVEYKVTAKRKFLNPFKKE